MILLLIWSGCGIEWVWLISVTINRSSSVPGCLAHPGHPKAMNIIKSLLFTKQKVAHDDII